MTSLVRQDEGKDRQQGGYHGNCPVRVEIRNSDIQQNSMSSGYYCKQF